MIDLFGLSKTAESEETQVPPEPQRPEPGSKGSHRLWAFLLVLDSLFVIVFGGAVATIVYKHWQAPAVVAAVPRRHPAPKPPEAAKPAETPAAAPTPVPPAKPVETAQAPEPEKPAPKPAPKAAARADSPRPPKPSLLTEAPRPRATPGLAGTAPAAPSAAPAARAAAPAASAPGKAQPVVFKLHAPRASSVQLVGAFIVHGGRKEMTKSEGTWSVKLYLNPGQYRYFFSVDKKKLLDPENPRSDRGASLLTIP